MYTLGASLILSLRMEFGLGGIIVVLCLSSIGWLALDWVSSKEARKRIRPGKALCHRSTREFESVFSDSLNLSSKDYSINSWSYLCGLSSDSLFLHR